jgi:hypothetical protein
MRSFTPSARVLLCTLLLSGCQVGTDKPEYGVSTGDDADSGGDDGNDGADGGDDGSTGGEDGDSGGNGDNSGDDGGGDDGGSTGDDGGSSDDGGAGCKISGTVFRDENLNTVPDDGEEVLEDRLVYVDADGNGEWDAAEKSVRSDASGVYCFNSLGPGEYTLRLDPEYVDLQTHPNAGDVVEDDFEDGSIDTNLWTVSGDGISETGGRLYVARDSIDDWIESKARFDEPFAFRVNWEYVTITDYPHGFALGRVCTEKPGSIGGPTFADSSGKWQAFGSMCAPGQGGGGAYTGEPVGEGLVQMVVLAADGDMSLHVDGNRIMHNHQFYTDGPYPAGFPGWYAEWLGPYDSGELAVEDFMGMHIVAVPHEVSLGEEGVSGIDFGTLHIP